MISGVIFDFDGTLVDSNEIKRQSFFDTTNHLPGARGFIEEMLSDPFFGDRYKIFNCLSEQLNSCNSGLDIDACALAASYTEKCEQEIANAPEVNGATQALDELSCMSIKVAVSSATPEFTLKKILTLRGLDSKVDLVLGAPETKEQHIEKIAKYFACDVSEMIYVGDSEVDRIAAENTGCHFIGVGEDDLRFDSKPALLMGSLNCLPELVRKFG